MYNPDLEALIDAALADGELTEKEKQILFKKAQGMGVDLDEFEMVLDARLVKLKKTEQEKTASSAPMSNKLGDVKKCPACGAMVQSYQGVCPECGYAFENIEANNSTKRFSELLDKVMAENNSMRPKGWESPKTLEKEKKQRMINAIQNFPIPTTKSDLFEFITSLQSKTRGKYGKAYRAKLDECLLKAKSLFSDDKTFSKLINDYETAKTKKKKRILTTIGIAIIGIIVLTVILIISHNRKELKTNSYVLKMKVEKLLADDNPQKAEKYLFDYEAPYGGYLDSEEPGVLVIGYYIDHEEIDKALSVYNRLLKIYNDKNSFSEPIVTYYISQKQYLKAEEFIDPDGYGSHYKDFIKRVLVAMAKDGKKDEAREFFNKRKDIIREDKVKEYMSLIDMY